jgi:diaminopimelate decarboxylase
MMHIAEKSGMQIEFSYGEADAYLKLPKASNSSIVAEAVHAQAADIDYAVKKNIQQSKFLFSQIKSFALSAK